MITYSTSYRSSQCELLDDFDLKGEEMKKMLSDLKRVNNWLGGTKTTLEGIAESLKSLTTAGTVTILDAGCGDGEMLRNCDRWARSKGIRLQLIGVDANPNILAEARERSREYENISYRAADIFDDESDFPEFDIALCTLFLHHFTEEKIIQLVNRLSSKAKCGVIINDLHRSRLAFWLFKLIGRVLLRTKIARHDGLVSIARGFKRDELVELSQKIPGKHTIRWKWAFRFQWIIQK